MCGIYLQLVVQNESLQIDKPEISVKNSIAAEAFSSEYNHQAYFHNDTYNEIEIKCVHLP